MSRLSRLARVWLAIEDELFPALACDTIERALYYFLLARTRLRGRRTVRLSILDISRATRLSAYLVRTRLRHLAAKCCLRVHNRSRLGTAWEIVLPRAVLGSSTRARRPPRINLNSLDCARDPRAREAIFRRDHNRCFYCLREISGRVAVLDHVVPRSRGGRSSPHNLVACCQECNSLKNTRPAADFLRWLFRTGRLSSSELEQRLAALARLTRGQLKIKLAA